MKKKPPAPPAKPRTRREKPKKPAPPALVVLKLRESAAGGSPGDAVDVCEVEKLERWRALRRTFRGLTLAPLITGIDAAAYRALVKKAIALDADYRPSNLFAFFIARSRAGTAERLLEALLSWDAVELAYVKTPASPTSYPPIGTYVSGQPYLDVAPGGIGVAAVWGLPLAQRTYGEGVGFVDVETGWVNNHEDLPAFTAIPTGTASATTSSDRGHGTSALGVVAAQGISYNTSQRRPIGIAPSASVRVADIGYGTGADTTNEANAIVTAAANMNFGDVMLLEFGIGSPSAPAGQCPAECEPANFQAIRLATALGMAVVEPAGNSRINLDLDTRSSSLTRTNPAFDSGAVLVTALFVNTHATTTDPANVATAKPLDGSSNYGSRADCSAWGNDVYAPGWLQDATHSAPSSSAQASTYTDGVGGNDFTGTSAAAAIVAGAAVLVQALAAKRPGLPFRLDPFELRDVLRTHGTTPNDPVIPASRIGRMPDLGDIVTNALGVAPFVYLKDSLDDDGSPRDGVFCRSPDIVPQQAPLANPQSLLSSANIDSDLGEDLVSGAPEAYVYLRARNHGGVDSGPVQAALWWSEPGALLCDTTLWNPIADVVIPQVSAGAAAVSGAITWSSPPEGHHCFIAALGGATVDKPPVFPTMDEFLHYVSYNRKVAWRNVNVVAVAGAGAKSGTGNGLTIHPLDLNVAGGPGGEHRMEIEVLAQLPAGAKLFFEAPAGLFERMIRRAPHVAKLEQREVGRLPISPHGRHRVGEILFREHERFRCRLVVHLPEERRDHVYTVALRQLWRGREVGRVTYRLVPAPLRQGPRC